MKEYKKLFNNKKKESILQYSPFFMCKNDFFQNITYL